MSSSPTERATTVEVTMPQMGVSVAEGTVVEWRKDVGDRVEADETICQVSTDKIDTEVPSPATGTVTEILVGVEQTVAVGSVLARIETGAGGGGPGGGALIGEAAAALDPPSSSPAPKPDPVGDNGGPHRRYSPVVARIADEHAIDLERVKGTGRSGRIRKQDVMALVGGDDVDAGGGLSRRRRTIGEHMKRSLDTAATCTTWMEVDMAGVEAARASLGLTALPFVARATVEALREHPTLNAWLEGDRYTRHDDAVHLGIAVSLGEEGLIVPVVRDAQDLSAEGLAKRIRDLAARARAGGLSPDEVRGATFTITNPGQYGSIMATPVINQPQVAILDLEAIVKRPVVADGDAIAVRPMTILGLSWDHRALDGAQAAQFLSAVRRRLEATVVDERER